METGTHPHLLIIEDDVLLNDMTKRLLTQHGYCVTSAYSGSEALLLIEKGTFDLILLDLMLPGIPGETVLEKMKSTMDIPIIGVSAKTDIDSKVNLMPVLFRLHCISQFVKLPAPASDHCYDYRIFYAGGFVFISHKDKYSTGYGLFALQVLGCRAIS